MALHAYGCQAHGGKLISLDDQAVVRDLAAANGTGGNTYDPYLVTHVLPMALVGAYGHFRQVVQRVPHDGAVTVKITPWRDGADTGQVITRVLASMDNPTVTAPLSATGSVFQFKVALSAFDAPASLGSGDYTVNPRRSAR